MTNPKCEICGFNEVEEEGDMCDDCEKEADDHADRYSKRLEKENGGKV